MQAPSFWWLQQPTLIARLLMPLASLYGAVAAHRLTHRGVRSALPVICVGNFTVGGAGKTPTAIAIARHLQARGEKPVFLIRGYGAKTSRVSRLVDLHHHNANDVGDEALLLARIAPTLVGTDRVASARRAEQLGASLIILDDGMQNPSLVQDFRLAVLDRRTGIGNGLCLPAGPLRAPFEGQMKSVSAVLVVGAGDNVAVLNQAIFSHGKPILCANLIASQKNAGLANQRIYAFAGIGLPGKFKATLEGLGATVVGWQSFPDHHIYSLKALRALQAKAAVLDAILMTTEKDLVRIAPLIGRLDKNQPLPLALPVELVFDDERALSTLLQMVLSARRG